MNNTNLFLLNRFFSRSTFDDIMTEGNSLVYSHAIYKYVPDASGETNGYCIKAMYDCLKREHQNEYYYKNTLLNKLLLGVHSLKTTSALTELPIGNSKADFILINGNAVVYEIKTDLDNFERLDSQINDYFKAFSRVVVVVSEHNCEEARKKFSNSPVGIYVLTSKSKIKREKEPIEFKNGLSKNIIFKILRKNEYESIVKRQFGELPDVSQFEYYRRCQMMFESIPIEQAYDLFVKALKCRAKIEMEEYEDIPYELKFLVYFSNYKKKDYFKLNSFLKEEYSHVFANL